MGSTGSRMLRTRGSSLTGSLEVGSSPRYMNRTQLWQVRVAFDNGGPVDELEPAWHTIEGITLPWPHQKPDTDAIGMDTVSEDLPHGHLKVILFREVLHQFVLTV